MKKYICGMFVMICSLIAFDQASAKMKVSGSIEQTFKSEKDGNSALGNETNITFKGKKSLDNGIDLKAKINLEDNEVDKSSLKFIKDNFSVEFGADTGQHIHSNLNPAVDDNSWQIGPSGMLADDAFTDYQAHDAQHVGFGYKTPLGSFALNYAPSSAGQSTGDSKTTDNGGSATEISFKGDLGYDNVKFLIGQEIVESDTSSDGTETERTVGIQYGINNNLTIGGSWRDFDDENISSTAVDQSISYGAAYAINRNWSTGIEFVDTKSEKAGSVEENAVTATVGYNLGGVGVAFGFTSVDNLGGTSGNTGEAFQIRTIAKF